MHEIREKQVSGQVISRMMGVGCMVAGISAFAAGDALTKWLVKEYPVTQIIAFRSVIGLIMLLPILGQKGFGQVATRRFGMHATRAILTLVGIICLFMALGMLSLPMVTGIFFAGPLMMTVLSIPILKERIDAQRWVAIAVGFGGVLLTLSPNDLALNFGACLALIGAMLYAVSMTMTRIMTKTETTISIVFWLLAISAVITGAMMPFQWVTPSPSDFGLLVALGVLAGAGLWLVTHAVKLAPISLLAPFDYLHLVFATIYGWLLWQDWPANSTLAGSAVIMGCNLYILHRERKGGCNEASVARVETDCPPP